MYTCAGGAEVFFFSRAVFECNLFFLTFHGLPGTEAAVCCGQLGKQRVPLVAEVIVNGKKKWSVPDDQFGHNWKHK